MSDYQLRYQSVDTIEHYSPLGRPVSATCTGYAAGAEGYSANELWASTAVVLDTASTTVSVAAAAGDTSMTVTSSANFAAGRRYWLTRTGGQGREVVVRRVAAGVLHLDQPLPEAVESASTIAGHRLTFDITAEHTASLRRGCRVEWELTWAGPVYSRESETFDIVLLPWSLDLTESYLEQVYPGFGELAGLGWEGLAREGERWVRGRLLGRSLTPDLCAERDLLRSAAAYRTLYLWTLGSVQSSTQSLAERLEKESLERIAEYLASEQWYDTEGDLARYLGYERIIVNGEVVELRREEVPQGRIPHIRWGVS